MTDRESEEGQVSAAIDGETCVSTAVALARTFAVTRHLTPDDRARLCIVVEELAANLCDHGRSSRDAPVLRLSLEAGKVRLVLTDSGAPFDPRGATTPLDPRGRGGGAGLALVRAWTEFVDYSSISGRNRLELFLPLEGAGLPGKRSPSDPSSGEAQ